MSEPLISITRKKAFTFAAFLVLYEFLVYIANDMIMPGMIEVANTFQASEAIIPTSLTVYILGGASLQIFLGPLSDRFGRRPVMLIGTLFFLICTVLIACSQSIDQFLWARFFQGMGLCFIGVIGYTTVQEIFSEIDAIRLVSIMANTSTIAPLLGPLAGALLLSYTNWRVLFLMIALFSLLAFGGLWLFMPETVGVQKKDDTWVKPVSLAPAVIAKNYLKLLSNIRFITGILTTGIANIVCLAWISISPIMLISETHLTLIEYGLWQIPVFTALIAGNFLLRRMTRSYSINQIILTGSFLAILGMILPIVFISIWEASYAWVIAGLLLYFFGLGICDGPLYRRTLFSTTVSKGTASALMSLCIMALLGLGIELIKYFYTLYHYNIKSFAWCCVVMGVIYLFSLSAFLYCERRNT